MEVYMRQPAVCVCSSVIDGRRHAPFTGQAGTRGNLHLLSQSSHKRLAEKIGQFFYPTGWKETLDPATHTRTTHKHTHWGSQWEHSQGICLSTIIQFRAARCTALTPPPAHLHEHKHICVNLFVSAYSSLNKCVGRCPSRELKLKVGITFSRLKGFIGKNPNRRMRQ